MLAIRTDLAMEAHQLWREKAGETSALRGVKAREETVEGFPVTRVEVLDQEGETALGKPRGIYFTLDVSALWRREENVFIRAARAVAALLGPLLPEEGPVLAAGLGNRAMTADALGPGVIDHLLVTRHLTEVLPGFRSVAGLSAGVLGGTTVVSVETASKDLLAQAGGDEEKLPRLQGRGLFVTPDDIDGKVRELAKVLGYGINLALQPDLAAEDLEALLA